jgi:hypothetical protein
MPPDQTIPSNEEPNNLRFNAFSPEYLYSFPTYYLSMESTTMVTTPKSSPQNPVDDQEESNWEREHPNESDRNQ